MSTSRIEPGDGRIITKVTLKATSVIPNQEDMVVEKELIADTGGATIVPFANLAGFFGRTTLSASGPMEHSNFGPELPLAGVTMEVEVEDHGGGNPENRECSKISSHFLPDGIFLSGDGLLGMDQFDELQADPVKNAAGDTAYLAKRS